MVTLNHVGEKEVLREIGRRGKYHLERLIKRLYDAEEAQEILHRIYYTRASSIITRSEAAMFGLSLPRFAFRAYIGKEGHFVNLRRNATLCDQVGNWGTRLTGNGRISQTVSEVPISTPPWQLMRKNICIADCVLRAGAKWSSDFHIIETDLGWAYGEGQSVVGTPFINHIPFAGGGLCSSAACFMASLLLQSHARHIYGVAEITLEAAANEDASEIALTGLNRWEMRNYFRKIGLTAEWQRISEIKDPYTGWPRRTSNYNYNYKETDLLAWALRAYLLSNMPVIFSTDLGRMFGNGMPHTPLETAAILRGKKNEGIDQELVNHGRHDIERNHAVVLVGCQSVMPQNPGDLDVVLNDPFSFPYLRASARQLWDAASYAPQSHMSVLNRGFFLPITPAEVTLPLCDSLPLGSDDFLKGRQRSLWKISQQVIGLHFPDCANLPFRPDGFYLSTIDGIKSSLLSQGLGDFLNYIQSELCRGFRPNHWVWLQLCGDPGEVSFWVWDAECREVPDGVIAQKNQILLLAFHRTATGEWKQLFKSERSDNQQSSQSVTNKTEEPLTGIDLSLASSFSTNGLISALENWPNDIESCEIYAFMQSNDAEVFLAPGVRYGPLAKRWLMRTLPMHIFNWGRDFRRAMSPIVRRIRQQKVGEPKLRIGVVNPICSVVNRMANLWQEYPDNSHVERIATRIKLAINECSHDLKVIGLTSYVPEIMSPFAETVQQAQRALEFLVELASRLRQKDREPVFLSLVGGSRIHGLWHGKGWLSSVDGELSSGIDFRSPKEAYYVANVLPKNDAIRMLQERLAPVIAKAVSLDVLLALQLEPGPTYVLNSRETVLGVLESIEVDGNTPSQKSLLSSVFGLCLDVGHWRMAGLRSGMMGTAMQDRIMHARLSLHASGHLSDRPILNVEEAGMLGTAALMLARLKPRSGYGSLEIEAIRNVEQLRTSVDLVRKHCFPNSSSKKGGAS